jgi:hypothetical protein
LSSVIAPKSVQPAAAFAADENPATANVAAKRVGTIRVLRVFMDVSFQKMTHEEHLPQPEEP